MWKRKEFASHEPIILANVEMVRSNDDIARSVGTYWRLRLVYRVVEPVVNLHSFHQVCGEAVAMCKSGDLVAYQLRVLKRRNTRISTVRVSYQKKNVPWSSVLELKLYITTIQHNHQKANQDHHESKPGYFFKGYLKASRHPKQFPQGRHDFVR